MRNLAPISGDITPFSALLEEVRSTWNTALAARGQLDGSLIKANHGYQIG